MDVTPRGLELADATSLPEKDLQQTPHHGAAKSGAVGAASASTSNLEALAAALLALPPAERERLAKLLAGSKRQANED
jgi:hypothetical protein